jgi:Carboxypeptidase regulatory-like domain/TonB-dependent Receptor Plug Domain
MAVAAQRNAQLSHQTRNRSRFRSNAPCWRALAVSALFCWGVLGTSRAQTNIGELRLTVTDPTGAAVQTNVKIQSAANQYQNTLATDQNGALDVKRLPFGEYNVQIDSPGFAPLSKTVEIGSELPTDIALQLSLASVSSQVLVTSNATLIDPEQAGSEAQLGASTIQSAASSLPGRSLQDLVNSQPGWVFEGNAVLHPRGSEYQTQFVIDGVPIQDNRSPSFGPELESDDVASMSIYTAGIPAEYGRKMGGVIEVNTLRDTNPGFHGSAALSGGSFDTSGAFFQGQYVWGKNTLGGSAEGSATAHYLNPVVPQNYTNRGTTGDFSLNYERDFTPNDRLTMSVRHELSRYEIPNEQVQQAAGQLQTADNFETMGIVSYQHIFSPHMIADFHGMMRDSAGDFYSNPNSIPVAVNQHNWFREGYFRGAITLDEGHHEIKAGVESDNNFLNENTAYTITDNSYFDTPCGSGAGQSPCTFAFRGSRPDLEQSAFVQDLYHADNWTIAAGLRWDHYQLIVNRKAFSPRFSIARFFPSAGMVLHFSYDRVFQTPSSQNILLSSSAQVESIDPADFLRVPVEPSLGNYYEVGLTKAFAGKLKLDANYYRRFVNNAADDNQFQNTSISFPISFDRQITYGAEGKLTLEPWRRFSGYLSYSYQLGNVWFPVNGGLFLGGDVQSVESQISGHLPDTQDQRHTLRGRLRYQLTPRLWFASGVQYDSGLPFDFQGDPQTVLAEYGQQVLDRINFDRGRIYPTTLTSASFGADLYQTDRFKVHFEADGENLTNTLDVLDFGGLFSGNAVGPPRSFSLRLQTDF